MNNLNPLTFFKLRRVKFAAPHFAYIHIKDSKTSTLNQINEWIEQRLNKRYYVNRTLLLDSKNRIVYSIKVGFEHKSELSIFLLSYPHQLTIYHEDPLVAKQITSKDDPNE